MKNEESHNIRLRKQTSIRLEELIAAVVGIDNFKSVLNNSMKIEKHKIRFCIPILAIKESHKELTSLDMK